MPSLVGGGGILEVPDYRQTELSPKVIPYMFWKPSSNPHFARYIRKSRLQNISLYEMEGCIFVPLSGAGCVPQGNIPYMGGAVRISQGSVRISLGTHRIMPP